jgi:folate-dependent phosphoribosylglycinamide formyltransferase PurN
MVHHVIAQVDRGEVIDKEQVPIHPSDTLEQLQERIHQTEHGLLVRAIAKVLKSQQQ